MWKEENSHPTCVLNMEMEIPTEGRAGRKQAPMGSSSTRKPDKGGQRESVLALGWLVCSSQKESECPEFIPLASSMFLLFSESTFFTLANENSNHFISTDKANFW